MTEPEFDRGGYPTESTLEAIRTWPFDDCAGLLEFVKDAWYYPDAVKVRGPRYRFATGGWSGNESLIDALGKNLMASSLCWQMSARGGLHVYKVCELEQ